MEDYSDSKLEETLNLEGSDQIKESIVEVVESSNGIQDDMSFENNILINEEESRNKVLEAVDLEKPVEVIDVSEPVGDTDVPVTSLTEQIGELETLLEDSVISDIKPDTEENVESDFLSLNEDKGLYLVEPDNVIEEIQESSTGSSYENDSVTATEPEVKEFPSPSGIEQNMESKETEELSVQSLVDNVEASPASTDILDKGLEVSNLLHASDNGEETNFKVFDANKKEFSGPFYIEHEGNVDDTLQASNANVPALDSFNDSGNKSKMAGSTENKPDIVISESKTCLSSWLGCCGLLEAFHLSGR